MADFRSQLSEVLDDMLARDVEPVFIVIDVVGAAYIKKEQGSESADRFRNDVMNAIAGAAPGAESFAYGDERVVGILPGYARLKTFAVVEKLRRMLPLLSQSFDCIVTPEFNIVGYEPEAGLSGLITQLTKPRVIIDTDAA